MQEFHIHPAGSDDCDGRSARRRKGSRGPWATLEGARNALRRLRADGAVRGEATVWVHPGTYRMSAPVEFGPDDSHTLFAAVEPDGAILDGGVELEGWRETEENGRRAWVLDLPEAALGRWFFRSLFVEGTRRPRARWPKFSPDKEGARNVLRIAEIRFPENRSLYAGDHWFRPRPGDVPGGPAFCDSEIVVLHHWVATRLGRPRLDPRTGWIECERDSVFNLYDTIDCQQGLARYYMDHLREALTEPGEWYLDRLAGRLIYLPQRDERLGHTRIVAPRLAMFIRTAGARPGRSPGPRDRIYARRVEGLRFEGLVFRHADWFHALADLLPHDRPRLAERPLGGAPQAASHVPAVIEFRHARGCGVERCTIEHIGFYGVAFGPGCADGVVRACHLRDLGAGGVRVDGAERDGPPYDRTGHLAVEDNTITDYGRVFHEAVGVLLMHAFGCRIVHNEIARGCYTGISCGWSWGYHDTITRDNLIENNRIHHIGQGVLSDMGGIYLLGVQPGTVVRGNHIFAVESAAYGGWGIYPDEGSSHLLIEHNWVHDTQGAALHIHYGREIVVRDNVFAATRLEGLIKISKAEGHIAANLMHNVLMGPAPALFEGGYAGDLRTAFRSDANLIAFPPRSVPPCRHPESRNDVPTVIPWTEWQSLGQDRHSRIADAGARLDRRRQTLRFPSGSPALKIGFRPYDWSLCGPRRTAESGSPSAR